MASTGPRPRGRGMIYDDDKDFKGEPASTGPRPRGRGMDNVLICSEIHTDASTGPRPRGRGMTMAFVRCLMELQLQRGRARAGAE